MTFKPMLASPADMNILRFPVIASPKVDGIRATVHDGVLMSRSMKPIKNLWLQDWCRTHADKLNGMDGELIVGPSNHSEVFRTTTSHVMAIEKRYFPFSFLIFDRFDMPHATFAERYQSIVCADLPERAEWIIQSQINDMAALDAYEDGELGLGYEGIMVRDPRGLYKQGRSSAIEQALNKVKRNEDMEAVILSVDERLHNANEAFTNELGRTARSSHKANMIGMDTLGCAYVRGLNGPYKDVEFSVGSGWDDAERARLWAYRDTLTGRILKIKYFPIGGKDRPRHPIVLGFRDPTDMSMEA